MCEPRRTNTVSPPVWGPERSEYTETESRLVVTKGLGKGNEELVFNGCKGSEFAGWESPGDDDGDGFTTVWTYLISWNLHDKVLMLVNFVWCVFYHNIKKKSLKSKKISTLLGKEGAGTEQQTIPLLKRSPLQTWIYHHLLVCVAFHQFFSLIKPRYICL